MNEENTIARSSEKEKVVGLVRKADEGFFVDSGNKLKIRLDDFIERYNGGVKIVYSPFMNNEDRNYVNNLLRIRNSY